ncbi:hypothetical protein ACJJJB_00310 (plasmid) [Microbulbifer sp. ANSA001]|uniref:hypothetical protein n=1 Tax=Microbulbifer sp. ANSA001 TaxID=3243358 RepID=UPI004041FEA9
MSELIYSAATANNLTAGQKVYQIDNGAHAQLLVRVVQTKEEVDLDKDGAPDQINFKTEAAAIDGDNNVLATEDESPTPYISPGKVDSIMASAVVEGTVDLTIEKARFIDEAIHRLLRLKTVLDAI